MATYSASIKYKYGSGRATYSANTTTGELKGKSETAVMDLLINKHKSTKDLQIIIVEIKWK